jgi:hypothetical protein
VPVIGEHCQKSLDLLHDQTISVTLYTNDYTPTLSDNVDCSNYTMAAFSGGDPYILGSWPGAADFTGGAEETHPEISWTPGEGASGYAYGVVLRDYMTGDLITGLRFATPKALIPGTPVTATIKGVLKDPAA